MGILRFILAISVLAIHSGVLGIPLPNEKPYPIWQMYLPEGRQAVALFYIISGFYMAMVLNGKYYNQTLKFYVNRFLRLWPTYIVMIILACLFTPIGTYVLEATSNCGLFVKSYIWLSNIFILGTDSFWMLSLDNCNLHYYPGFINENSNGFKLLINQPAFTISIEIIFYIMAPFILKSLKRVWLYFFVGLAFTFYMVISGNVNAIYQYHFFPSSFIYFGLGALAWHYAQNKTFKLSEKHIVIILISSIIIMFVQSLLPMIIILCFTIMIPKLFELTKHSKLDKLIGELSYPIYIVHYPVLMYLWKYQISAYTLGLWCFFITISIALLLHFIVESPIDKLRQRYANNN